MEVLSTTLLYIHIACGSASLITFWIPAFTRKGGRLHRKVGLVYVYLMMVVVITAAILSIENAIQGQTNSALFLGFLSVLSAQPLWHGVAVLKNKNNQGRNYQRIRFVFAAILFLFGSFLMYYGIFLIDDGMRVLMIFFGVFGISSIRDLNNIVRNNGNKINWYQEHFKGMIISGVAAYTAFLAFGGRQFMSEILPGMWQILPWIAPTLLGIVAMRLLDRYYTSKGIIKSKRQAA